MLEYIKDIRVHPAKTFLNYGIPISINSDDPGFFGYLGVNLDFYVCAVALEFGNKYFSILL